MSVRWLLGRATPVMLGGLVLTAVACGSATLISPGNGGASGAGPAGATGAAGATGVAGKGGNRGTGGGALGAAGAFGGAGGMSGSGGIASPDGGSAGVDGKAGGGASGASGAAGQAGASGTAGGGGANASGGTSGSSGASAAGGAGGSQGTGGGPACTLGTVQNCGACGVGCAGDNATWACVAHACQVVGCGSGYEDCNGMASDGCEHDVTADPQNCGACDQVCASGVCAASACLTRVNYGLTNVTGSDVVSWPADYLAGVQVCTTAPGTLVALGADIATNQNNFYLALYQGAISPITLIAGTGKLVSNTGTVEGKVTATSLPTGCYWLMLTSDSAASIRSAGSAANWLYVIQPFAPLPASFSGVGFAPYSSTTAPALYIGVLE